MQPGTRHTPAARAAISEGASRRHAYQRASAAAHALIAADLPPGDAELQRAVAEALSLAPNGSRKHWERILSALERGYAVRLKIRQPFYLPITPALLADIESAFTPTE